MNFGEKLKMLRLDAKLSQQDVADELGISQSTVGNMEIGKRMPSIEVAVHIANFYGVSLDYLFGDAPTKAGFEISGEGYKIKTPAELADVDVKRVIQQGDESLSPDEIAAIRRMLSEQSKG